MKSVATFWTFKCPVCRKVFRSDHGPGEPCCTGPSEMRDEHPMTIMRLDKVEYRAVDPLVAEARANGPLILAG